MLIQVNHAGAKCWHAALIVSSGSPLIIGVFVQALNPQTVVKLLQDNTNPPLHACGCGCGCDPHPLNPAPCITLRLLFPPKGGFVLISPLASNDPCTYKSISITRYYILHCSLANQQINLKLSGP